VPTLGTSPKKENRAMIPGGGAFCTKDGKEGGGGSAQKRPGGVTQHREKRHQIQEKGGGSF